MIIKDIDADDVRHQFRGDVDRFSNFELQAIVDYFNDKYGDDVELKYDLFSGWRIASNSREALRDFAEKADFKKFDNEIKKKLNGELLDEHGEYKKEAEEMFRDALIDCCEDVTFCLGYILYR